MSELITIIGPTASGKTPFAVALANEIEGEIISGDSRQIYRSMDIGTGKDINEYTIDNQSIAYHLIDIREPGDKYTLFDFQQDFHASYQEIISRNKNPILCGGTGLYIESILKGYELKKVPQNDKLRKSLETKSLQELSTILSTYKKLHNTTDIDTKQRAIRAIEIATFQQKNDASTEQFPPVSSVIIGLNIDREARRKKITNRLKARIEEGMIEEVKNILSSGVSPQDLIYYGLEYKYVTLHAIGELSFVDMFNQLEIAIHQFAKRQMTWFRGMERRGLKINWIDALLPMDEKLDRAKKIIKTKMQLTPITI